MKRYSYLLTVVFVTLLFVGCGSSEPAPTSTKPELSPSVVQSMNIQKSDEQTSVEEESNQ